jgi:hypothetical protein
MLTLQIVISCVFVSSHNIVLAIYWLFIGLCVFVAVRNYYKKQFENEIKPKIMGAILKSFGNFTWYTDTSCKYKSCKLTNRKQLIINSGLFKSPYFIVFDDNFSGNYKNINVEISEVSIGTKNRIGLISLIKILISCLISHRSLISLIRNLFFEEFRGLVVSLDMNKNFTGYSIIVPDTLVEQRHQGMDKVGLEDVEFEKLYDVYSTDQVESRYLITPAFIERFKNISRVFKTTDIRCSFKDKQILLAITAEEDLFSIGKLTQPVTDPAPYYKLFEEFIAVLSLIDVLKLNQKLGL